MKNLFFLSCCLLLSSVAFTQTSLGGKVTDIDTGEELIGTNVTLSKDGVFVTGTSTDFDGNYKVIIDPGTYDLEFSYIGYPTEKVTGVVAKIGQNNKLDFSFENIPPDYGCCGCGCCYSRYYKVPLLNVYETSSGITFSDENIELMPIKNINTIIGTAPGVSFSR